MTNTTEEPLSSPDVISSDGVVEAVPAAEPSTAVGATGVRGRIIPWHWLGVQNIGVIYVLLLIIVLFSFWAPETFPTWNTVVSVLNQNAITGLIALALVAPLSARVFDLSIGYTVGLTNVMVAWFLVEKGLPTWQAVALSAALGLLVGLVNAAIIVGFEIDSFIVTLATGALIGAFTTLISNNQAIVGIELSGSFGKMATTNIQGIALPVGLMLVAAVGLWYVLNFTAAGRRVYATGFNEVAARLTGIHTKRIKFATLVVSGAVAGAAGILLASQVSSGSPGIGQPYLLSAFAAAFLGATQFGGRFNAAGTVMAVLMLGTGNTGLTLVGAPVWSREMFNGTVLIIALVATSAQMRLIPRLVARWRAGRQV